MSVYSIVFSPTGGTEKVMEILEKEFRAEKRFDLTMESDYGHIRFGEEDICLIGVPSYGGRVPQIAVERIRTLKGNRARVIPVVVYGNRAYEDTLLELKNEAESCGFRTSGAVAAVAEHSIMHQFGAGRPDAEDEKELRQFAQTIQCRMNEKQENKTVNEAGKEIMDNAADESVQVPGNFPYREYGVLPLRPKANKKCRQCGLCAARCPAGAIPKENPSVTDEKKCITCMRCVEICPEHARGVSRILLSAASQKLKKACAGRKKNELLI